MAEYIDKEQLLSDLYSKQDDENLDVMLEIANFPAADVVSESAYKQIMWERDLAIQQLRSDYGVGLGEKKNVDVATVVSCRDCKECSRFPEKNIEPGEAGLCRWSGMVMNLDAFCSYGEKREDNHD